MVDMNATTSVSGLKHPIGNNIDVLPEIENEDCETGIIIADHEEGQIIEDVEEFEDISSDEDPIVFTEADEVSMRKRIEELELRNAELEKIANISVINNYDLGTNKIVSQPENKIVDIIDLSDYDEYPPNEVITSAFVPYDANYNTLNYYSEFNKINSCFPTNSIKSYHKSRKHRKRAHSPENKNYDESRTGKISRYKKRRRRSLSSSLGVSNTARQKSSNTKHHHSRSKRSKRKRRVKNQYDSFSNNSDSEKSDNFELNREELRKAVKRNSETIRKGNLQNIVSNKKIEIMNQNKDNNDDDVIEIENNKEVEQITLKLTNEGGDNNVLVSDDSESLEEQTLRLIALKSAIVKKHLDRQKRKEIEEKKPYSPSDFDYWCTGINIQNSPKDFDELECIDSNNISPSESPINISEEEANTKPIDIDIDNSDSDSDIPQFIDTPKSWQSTLPSLDVLKKLAPPPPQITLFSPTQLKVDDKYIKDCIEDDNKLIISQKNSSPEDLSDEEELALRALLLSTMNSPKVNNMVAKKTVLTENSQNTVINQIIETQTKNIKLDILDNVKSPNLIEKDRAYNESNTDLHQNILEKKNAESLLKEAVKRLKTTTLNDLSENDEISDGNIYSNQYKVDKCTQFSISGIKNNFKEIQFSVERELSESILETDTVSPNTSKGDELLTKSRKKLNKFMQCFNKEKLSNSELDQIQNSTETSDEDQDHLSDINSCDIERPEEENRSQSCIEALQKIIELNYEKLVNIGPEENKVEFSAENEKEMETEVELPLAEDHIEILEDLQSTKSGLLQQNEILKPPKKEVSCSPEHTEILKQHEKEVSCSLEPREIFKKVENEASCSLDNVQIPKISQREENYLLNIVQIENQDFGKEITDQVNKEHFQKINIESETANKKCISVANLIQNKIDTSLEITKKIESLQKLSDSIEQAAKITAKAKASLDVNNSQSINSKSLIANHIVQNRKIVKINKIINQTSSSTLNRNHVLNQNIQSNKLSSLSVAPINSRLSPKTVNETSSNSIRVSKINRTSGKIIICVGVTSSSEEEDDILEDLDNKSNKHKEVSYDDNASPMSFQMDSPYYSPLVISFNEDESQVEESQHNLTSAEENILKNVPKIEKNLSLSKNVVNDVFQAKLDKFLKNARTQVELEKKGEKKSENSNLEPKTPVLKTIQSVNSSVATPVAVRHLPESSQLEYRMLINRMKILERQKFLKNQQEIENISESNDKVNEDLRLKPDNSNNSSIQNENSIIQHADNRSISHIADDPIKKNNSDNVDEISKKLNPVFEENDQIIVSVNDIKKDKKLKQNLELLKKYETAYEKNSNSIIENLNRSLKFVAMGKEAKTKKVLLESKLEKLKIELKICETDIKLQNQKIAKIYPAISKSYNTIINLKGRRVKLNKISKHLGKVFNGTSYRLKEAHTIEIETKYKHLSNEINNLKNLKIDDIEKSKTNLEIKNTIKTIANVNSKIILPKDTILTSGEIEENKEKLIATKSKNITFNISRNNSESHRVSVDTQPSQSENELKTINFENNIEETILQNNSPDLDQNEPELDETGRIILTEKSQNNDETKFEYISPLDFLNERQNTCSDSTINPNEVICPFQLMGQCDDKDCKYNHLNLDYFSHYSE